MSKPKQSRRIEEQVQRPAEATGATPVQLIITVAGVIHVNGTIFDGEYSAMVLPSDVPDPNDIHDALWAWSNLGPGHPVASHVRGISIDPRYRYEVPQQAATATETNGNEQGADVPNNA